MSKRVVVLGASGSIGKQALKVIKENKNKFYVKKISVGKNIAELIEILANFPSIKQVALLADDKLELLKKQFPGVAFSIGNEAITDLLEDEDYDVVVNGIVGFAGLIPSIKVIESNKVLALANKETMVVAGEIINSLLEKYTQAKIIPVDSEHNAIFQCLQGNKFEIKRLLLSASGGSFRDLTIEELNNVSVEDALRHPNWEMGASITVDSATMFNKGLEVIEAHHLFKMPYDKIEVLLHRESIVHSMVEYVDGSTIAQLSKPSMELPIAYALQYPERLNSSVASIDYTKSFTLSFEPMDYQKYKALMISYKAGIAGHSMPCVLNASKEVATQAFLNKEIKFLDIVELVEKAITAHKIVEDPTIEQLIKIDNATRKYVLRLIKGIEYGNN